MQYYQPCVHAELLSVSHRTGLFWGCWPTWACCFQLFWPRAVSSCWVTGSVWWDITLTKLSNTQHSILVNWWRLPMESELANISLTSILWAVTSWVNPICFALRPRLTCFPKRTTECSVYILYSWVRQPLEAHLPLNAEWTPFFILQFSWKGVFIIWGPGIVQQVQLSVVKI